MLDFFVIYAQQFSTICRNIINRMHVHVTCIKDNFNKVKLISPLKQKTYNAGSLVLRCYCGYTTNDYNI